MEKRNVVEAGRTPARTEKTAEVVDAGVNAFRAAKLTKNALKRKQEEPPHAAK